MKKPQRVIAQGSLAIATAILPILLFRGTTSLFAMMLTPIFIGFWFFRKNTSYFWSVIISYLLLVAILATTQVAFAFVYLLLGRVLHHIFHHIPSIRWTHRILYAFVTAFSILISMLLTQWIFQIPLITIMIRLGRGFVGFAMIVLVEAILVSIAHMFLYDLLKKHVSFRMME